MYFVYFLRSESNTSKTYIGQTNNLERRLAEHNSPEAGKYIKQFQPWSIEHFILAETRAVAEEAERYFKSSSGQEKFRNFATANPDHPNTIQGFFRSQEARRKFGRSSFQISANTIRLVSAVVTE